MAGRLWAQTADSTANRQQDGLRISILTCGVGDELYASFGHTGVRVIDSTKGTDEVYNYGTFNFADPDFYSKFTLGKLLYYLDKSTFDEFIQEYKIEKRRVDEQELILPLEDKRKIVAYLENNLLPQNAGYHYDFLFDNCATRVRDIFPKVLGKDFQFGNILNDEKVSYRSVINQYLSQKHWERLGIDLLLGSRVDGLMTDSTSMFLPDFLYKGLETAQYRGHNISMPNKVIIPKTFVPVHTLNIPFWVFTVVLILLILSYFITALKWLKATLNFLLLFLTGALGLFVLFMWLCTDHQACAYNWNILWAIPLNIIVAFIAHKRLKWLKAYALLGITLLIVSLLVTIIGIQQLPFLEIIPLLAAMMFIYVDMYKRNVLMPSKTPVEGGH